MDILRSRMGQVACEKGVKVGGEKEKLSRKGYLFHDQNRGGGEAESNVGKRKGEGQLGIACSEGKRKQERKEEREGMTHLRPLEARPEESGGKEPFSRD